MKAIMQLVVAFIIAMILALVISMTDDRNRSNQQPSRTVMYGPSRPEPRPKPAERVAPFHMDDDGKQEDRKEFIQQRIADGLFLRVGYDGGTLPKVWVSQRFLMLDIKTRNTLLEVVYAYYSIEDDSFGMTADGLMCLPLGVKIDDGTIGGKTIGEYDPVDGLR